VIRAADLIERKRNGEQLSDEEITELVLRFARGEVPDYQMAAWCMAVYFKGLSGRETHALTDAMIRSGETLELGKALGRKVVDKHSTGGVGDKTSLAVGPIVAACGVPFGKMSGRGLGHTGGTLDKLDSIPGYRTAPDLALFRKVVAEAGCAIIGQTADLAPADRRLYAIRDVTATVESIPLITASILSKKLAAGLQGLVMDVKFGSGAFMAEVDKARELAESIATVATNAGLPTTALLTDMNQVLGRSAGNALEVREAIDWLTGKARDSRLDEVTLGLGAEMLMLGRLAADAADARRRLIAARDSGAAAERFQRMVAALGGPADLLEQPDKHLQRAAVQGVVAATRTGYVARIDVRAIGLAVLALGGGRSRVEDRIDYSVGVTEVRGIGERVEAGEPLAIAHARSDGEAAQAAAALAGAVAIADSAVTPGPVLGRRIAGH
jgi:thymidine phosphorylase